MSGACRRSVLRAGLAGVLAACVPACSTGGYTGPERVLSVAGGESGGFYLAFAELLAAETSAAEPRLRTTALPTEGSLANVELLRSGRAQLGLVLADTAQAALAGELPGGQRTPLRALGRVYENYMQVVVPANSTASIVADLAGRTLSLGAPGSGASLFGQRLLAATGLSSGDSSAGTPRVNVVQLRLADAVTALTSGRVDALLWSSGVPTPTLTQLDERLGIRLLPLDSALPALRARHGLVYERVTVPAGAYRLVREVPTVGVANLLLCSPDLPDDVAAAVTRVLVERAARLVPKEALGTQFLDVRTLVGTSGVPLHPGAAEVYRAVHG
ncbi:hypothetical protein LX15_001594 [Streptoalloteichus tenebrarius]|uniref:TAXI family TRAP transporter solute-binding subunit n=1 Tax=Streptoalloteichus tenebrarius (strain ATCC 17920 / DSM 40477 / JCM 4838 / CBS 697.72 / NBRC 16177 / NCIMB 11028 / NRRL B-12390 / A12253. 1 / ISP 5477) TaxID=1933 RepID=A0ABT1HQX5_STRSD|nr:TAXI family TRAP transporter solute-binding subunit [Streptoalloteichus tenebrarius]MCP2257908.1 hypothetical protein [Streptoalloteichus tenebrarius]BFE99727.1 TAXI family TRAP transporter solute-binding subunit [Streptoalloteichus tenebrarius]